VISVGVFYISNYILPGFVSITSQVPLDKSQYSEATQKNQPWFHGRFDIEEGGVERVTDDQRQQNTTEFWNAATFWYDLTSLLRYRSVLTDWETGSVQTWPLPHSTSDPSVALWVSRVLGLLHRHPGRQPR
jgi:hypothetical protein